MAHVLRRIDLQDTDEVRPVLESLGVQEASNAFEASRKRPAHTMGSVYATAEAVLDVYATRG